MVMRPRSIPLLSENLALSDSLGRGRGRGGDSPTQEGSSSLRLEGWAVLDVQKLESHLHPPVDAGVCMAAFLWASVSQINRNSCGQGKCRDPCWFKQSRT